MTELNGNMSTAEIYRHVLLDLYRWAKRIGHYHTVKHIESFATFIGIGKLV